MLPRLKGPVWPKTGARGAHPCSRVWRPGRRPWPGWGRRGRGLPRPGPRPGALWEEEGQEEHHPWPPRLRQTPRPLSREG
jgi:hypothetical protein